MNPNWFARLMGWALRLTAVEDDKGGAAAGGAGDDKGGTAAGGAGDKGGGGGADDKGAGAGDKGGDGDKGAAAGAGDKGGAAGADPWLGIREKYAGGDEKKLGKLSRYATPEAALDAFISLQDRLRAGELKAQLPKNATPEQQAAWRAENGIPESADKYDLKLGKDIEIRPEDKPYVDSMLKAIHAKGANGEIANTVVGLYYDVQRQMTEARATQDAEFAKQSEDALRVDWGKEYRLNMNLVTALTSQMPADVRELFERGRLANGDPLMSHPGTLKWLNGLAREINPVATLVPTGEGDIAGTIEAEIKQIEGWMRAPAGSPDHKKYWKDDAVQARYRDLLDGKERASGKKK